MRKKPFRPPDTVTVSVHRGGAVLEANVKWQDAQLVLQQFLEVYRAASKRYPELIETLPAVGGGSIEYVDDFSGEARKKRIGF